MAKLKDADKRQIIIEYAAGATQRELGEKYKVSCATITKLLGKEKSKQKLAKVSNVKNQESESLKHKAHAAITQIIDDLPDDIKKAPLRDKIAAMERLRDMFGLPEDTIEDVTHIEVEIEDASGGEDEADG